MAQAVVFTKSYTSLGTPIIPSTTGVPDSVLNGISSRYIVTISATRALEPKAYLTVNAYLQKEFNLDVASSWGDVGAGTPKSSADNDVQAISGLIGMQRSLVSTVNSRRKWTGSTAVKISMVLKFEAINNITNEVILPCMKLQQLALPREGNTFGFFLIPPGPNPFSIGSIARGDKISLSIGGNFLTFDYIIITGVGVKFQNRMGTQGPIGAEVTISMETYEMLTQEKLAAASNLKEVTSNSGNHNPHGAILTQPIGVTTVSPQQHAAGKG